MPAKALWLLQIPEIVSLLETFDVPVADRCGHDVVEQSGWERRDAVDHRVRRVDDIDRNGARRSQERGDLPGLGGRDREHGGHDLVGHSAGVCERGRGRS